MSLLTPLGRGSTHLPEHNVDDHVTEEQRHAAREPLHSGKLAPRMSGCNREPQVVLGELLYDRGGEQAAKMRNQMRKSA